MDNFISKKLESLFLSNGEVNEMERLSKIAEKNEKEWLEEYVSRLKDNRYWDVDFIDYKCWKVFVMEYIDDINSYRDEFINDGGKISFEDASWGLYYIATNEEHKFINEPAQA